MRRTLQFTLDADGVARSCSGDPSANVVGAPERNYRVTLHPGRVVTAIDHEDLGRHSAPGRAQQKHGGIRHV